MGVLFARTPLVESVSAEGVLIMALINGLMGVASDVVKIATAPAEIATDLVRVVTHPLAVVATEVVTEVKEVTRNKTD